MEIGPAGCKPPGL